MMLILSISWKILQLLEWISFISHEFYFEKGVGNVGEDFGVVRQIGAFWSSRHFQNKQLRLDK